MKKSRPIEITLLVIIVATLTALQVVSVVYVFYFSGWSGEFEGVVNSLFARRFLPLSVGAVVVIETIMTIMSLVLTLLLLKPSNRIRWTYAAWIAFSVLYGIATVGCLSYTAFHIAGCIVMALILFNPRAGRFYQ